MKKKQILNLSRILGRMKQVKRTGWIRHKVINPESDAEHSYSLAMLIMLFAPANLDKLKCLQLALIHDLPEIYCGDITPGELDLEKKSELEKNAMKMVVKDLELPLLQDLFTEYEQHSSPEAQFVWVMDRLDNVFTARMYQDTQRIQLVQEFADSAFERLYYLKDTELRAELSKIMTALTEK
ncbi:MAG: HD domain-containing protein [Alphaproteobacteria bacterium]|nr:HD domain-containing protein [Alphaproteobacteria bacterium]